ncbi:MAG TPA: hypothetical protein VK832_18450, partial [Burkholderiaceae bacterium]|nr:hypothetical protein [Burkholderiaceae bacterium]
HPYVRDFLCWIIEFAELALADTRRWDSQYRRPNAARSVLYGVLALATAMRDDAALNTALLVAGRQDAMEAFKEANGADWEHVSQSEYLLSIQYCLMEGDLSAAKQMLDCKRKFIWTQQWHDWLAQFISNATLINAPPLSDANAVQEFDACFDRIRDPNFKHSKEKGKMMSGSRALLSLHLAILRHMWIEGGSLAGNWRTILTSISRP